MACCGVGALTIEGEHSADRKASDSKYVAGKVQAERAKRSGEIDKESLINIRLRTLDHILQCC